MRPTAGVEGILILDADGLVVRTTMSPEDAAKHSSPTLQLVQRARDVVALEKGNELLMLTIRTKKSELLFCSEGGGAYSILVVQNPSAER